MTQKKTIGGNRLGAGKKMTVDLKTYERSTHDLSYVWRSTMSAGTLVPFMNKVALPGDTFDINLDADIKTHPTIGPLFGSFKVQLDVFQCPIRLYQGQLHNNKLGIGLDMSKVKLPQIKVVAPVLNDNEELAGQQINPSCILSYLGIRGVGRQKTEEQDEDIYRDFNAVPYLAYWDIYKNYYANKQEEIGAVIHALSAPANINYVVIYDPAAKTKNMNAPLAATAINNLSVARIDIVTNTNEQPDPNSIDLVMYNGGREYRINLGKVGKNWIWNGVDNMKSETIDLDWFEDGSSWEGVRYTENPLAGEPRVYTFDLENLDTMREDILAYTKNPSAFMITSATYAPYGLPLGANNKDKFARYSQEGLALKTYQSDIHNNWLSTEWIDGENGINAITAIDTSEGSFTIDTLQLSKKVYDMLNRIAISGGSYDDWQDAVYSHDRYVRAESPIYCGGLSKELVFQEVVSNAEAATDGNTQPLGTLAGKGVMGKKHKGGNITIKVDEPSYIMGIISLTPRIDYSQGNEWDVNLQTMDDLHKPALDEIGFQDLITDQMAYWSTEIDDSGEKTFKSAGKQPAWLNYMTDYNKTYGNFALENNEMFMTLNRRYEKEAGSAEIKDLTTYIDPVKFNHIFAETSRDAQNYWTQIAVGITARRKISARIMPNL